MRDVLLRDGVVAEIAERIDARRRGRRGRRPRGQGRHAGVHRHPRPPARAGAGAQGDGRDRDARGGGGGVHGGRLHGEHASGERHGGGDRAHPVAGAPLRVRARLSGGRGVEGARRRGARRDRAAAAAPACVAISDDGRPVRSSELMRRALSYARHFDAAAGAARAGHGALGRRRDARGRVVDAARRARRSRAPPRTRWWRATCCWSSSPAAATTCSTPRRARSLELIRDGKRRGLDVTCEVTPHHLFLTDEEVAKSGLSTNTKMNPPLRSERDREALLAGLADGTVDVIATDHAPHHVDEKRVPFAVAPFGIVGLETAVGLCLDRLVRPGPDRPGAAGRSAVVRAGARDGHPGRDARAPAARPTSPCSTSTPSGRSSRSLPEQVAQHAVRRVVGQGRRRR